MADPNLGMVRFDKMRRAIIEAKSVDEVKDIIDKTEALRVYTRQAGMALESQNQVAEIGLRAKRRGGELLAEMERSKGGRPIENSLQSVTSFADQIKAAGINNRKAHNWQRIAAIPEVEFEEHIERTKEAERELTTAGIVRFAKELEQEEKREDNRELVSGLATIDTLTETYQTIVLDPPWDWGDEGDQDQLGRARPTYATMTIDEIQALPIADLTQDNAHIYLWITNRSLPKGFRLLDAWGFRYITMLTWVKPSFGMGNYFRGSTEQVLFGVRGSLPLLRHDVGTCFHAKRPGPHSAKPDEFYALVETCSPGPWLDLFSRKERNGWATWGAEV